MMKYYSQSKYLIAGFVALSQSAVLCYMIESRAQILRNGQEVVLQTVPVDPRDLMRGDYVRLRYPFSVVKLSTIDDKNDTLKDKSLIQESHPVYVVLKKGNSQAWDFVRASLNPIDDLGEQEVMMVGRTPKHFLLVTNENIRLYFGIERYYVPEGLGKAIEDAQEQSQINVAVAVDKTGQAQIKSLSLNGKILFAEPLY